MSVQCGYHSSVHSIPRNSSKEGEKKDGNWDESFDATAAFLGPNLWDKTVPYNDDFKMEYMDLDEFFTENGIAVPNHEMTAANRNHHAHHPHHHHPHQAAHHNHHPHHNQQQQAQHQQQQPQQQQEQDHHHSPHHQSPHPSHQQSPLPPTPVTPTPPRLQQVPPQPKPTPPPDSTSTPPTPPTSPFEKPVEIKEEMSSEKNINFDGRACAKSRSCMMLENDLRVKLELKFSPADLALATSPGQERFDPINHTFSEDELKPQPMVKKSKKQLVPNDMKDDKYWARRKKNNMAAKRSRDARRVKENQIAMRASFLERENTTLRKEIDVVQRENSALKEKLAKYERC